MLIACAQEKDGSSEEPADLVTPGKSDLNNVENDSDEDTSDEDTSDEDTAEADTGDYEPVPDIDGAPFEPDSIDAFFFPEDDPVWVLTAKEGTTWLYIENYPRFGGATGAETRTLDADEVNYATCGVCVLLKTDCSVHGDHAHCGASYMPEAGSRITFDELGSGEGAGWSGSLTPIRFVEVSIDGSSYQTTPIEGGDQIELDSWSFDVVLKTN